MITTLPILPLDERLLMVGRKLLTTVADALVDPPALQYLTGPMPAVTAGCEGQLTVGLIRLLRGVAGVPDLRPNPRAEIRVVTAEWHLELWRCFPVEEDDTIEVQDEAGVSWIRDYAAVKGALDSLLTPAPQRTPQQLPGAITGMVSEISAITPQGGSRGLRAICQVTAG